MTYVPEKHPIQPLECDEHGVIRFKQNAIVRFLLDDGETDMNKLARMPFSDEDREQFAQLIGYSLTGFGELSYVSDATYSAAEAKYVHAQNGNPLSDANARLIATESQLQELRDNLREPIANLFGIHPDDLKGR